ncbi:unnamed protein product [Pocillopora meandrina]|uniref:Caspase recruitment domain-containing protein n=1 Tax=Pocillopora meandrina TaxID=46732 RepID=A0AAU9VT24_9CNID|nr:unnamed protein product [Pocillopora meandrina]
MKSHLLSSLEMDREERDLISENITQLVEDVIPVDMLPYLPCLTKSDKEKIKCEETNHGSMRAAQELIDRLVRRRNSFRQFIEALCETGCRHLAEQLFPLQFHEGNEQENVIRDERDDRTQGMIVADFSTQIALDDVNHA